MRGRRCCAVTKVLAAVLCVGGSVIAPARPAMPPGQAREGGESVGRRAAGQLELNATCRIERNRGREELRGDGSQHERVRSSYAATSLQVTLHFVQDWQGK
jgi:hypothetical protein